MPITITDAPFTLPAHAKAIYVAAFNTAYDGTCEDRSDRDACASKIAWSAVKKDYAQVDGKWVSKAAYASVHIRITKASLLDDGRMRWQGVASDVAPDAYKERTTLDLFRDWMARIESGETVDYLPDPRTPFLGLSHYPSLDGFGEAGLTDAMFIDGNCFKVRGFFNDTPLGRALFKAVRDELELIKRGEVPDNPIRISAAWWDIEHMHGDLRFIRRSLDERCPMCLQSAARIFLKGQLDHYAATRVPVNPRTTLQLEEKSMADKITRHDDAATIVDPALAQELEERAQAEMVGRSLADDDTTSPALVVKSEEEDPVADAGDAIEETENTPEEPEEEEAAPTLEAQADYVEVWKPYGGATSIAAAESWLEAQELEWKVYDAWSMFRAVMENILDDESEEDKLGAVRQAIAEFGGSVEALKARMSDAYLVQPIQKGTIMDEQENVTTEGSTSEEEEPVTEQTETPAAPLTDNPGGAFWLAFQSAVADPSISRAQLMERAQAALETLAGEVRGAIDNTRPPDVADEVKAAVDKALAEHVNPLSEKIDLLLAKSQAAAPASAIPVQKSATAAPPPATPQQPMSPLTRQIRASVGLAH